jgi:hypothetical protein
LKPSLPLVLGLLVPHLAAAATCADIALQKGTVLTTSSQDFLTDLIGKIQRRAVERHVYKAASSVDGFTAAVVNEWFAPDLGLIGKTEVYDADGRLLATQRLVHVAAP